MYLCTASTVLGLVLAILLSAVLGFVLDSQSTFLCFRKIFGSIVLILNVLRFSTLQVHLSTFSIYAVKIYLFLVNKMKLS